MVGNCKILAWKPWSETTGLADYTNSLSVSTAWHSLEPSTARGWSTCPRGDGTTSAPCTSTTTESEIKEWPVSRGSGSWWNSWNWPFGDVGSLDTACKVDALCRPWSWRAWIWVVMGWSRRKQHHNGVRNLSNIRKSKLKNLYLFDCQLTSQRTEFLRNLIKSSSSTWVALPTCRLQPLLRNHCFPPPVQKDHGTLHGKLQPDSALDPDVPFDRLTILKLSSLRLSRVEPHRGSAGLELTVQDSQSGQAEHHEYLHHRGSPERHPYPRTARTVSAAE